MRQSAIARPQRRCRRRRGCLRCRWRRQDLRPQSGQQQTLWHEAPPFVTGVRINRVEIPVAAGGVDDLGHDGRRRQARSLGPEAPEFDRVAGRPGVGHAAMGGVALEVGPVTGGGRVRRCNLDWRKDGRLVGVVDDQVDPGEGDDDQGRRRQLGAEPARPSLRLRQGRYPARSRTRGGPAIELAGRSRAQRDHPRRRRSKSIHERALQLGGERRVWPAPPMERAGPVDRGKQGWVKRRSEARQFIGGSAPVEGVPVVSEVVPLRVTPSHPHGWPPSPGR